MKTKNIFITVVLAIIFINISKVSSAKCVSNGISRTNKIIYSVNNKQDFCTMLPYCINNNIPLIMSNTNGDAISEFSIGYNGHIVKLENRDVLQLIKEKFDKDTLIISSDKDNKIVILGGQIACNFNCPIIYESNINNFFVNNKNKYKKIIVLGDVNFDYKGDSEVVKYKSIQDIQHLYDENMVNCKLNIYIENDEYDVYGLYLAAYRKGKIYFDVNNIEDINKYFAWIIKPEYFSPKKYLELYSYIEKKSNYNYDKGIGVITGKTYEDVNLLLLRSFFYNDIEKPNNILDIEPLANKKNQSMQGINGTYDVIGEHIKDFNYVLKKMHDSKYIRIFGHGSYNSIELENKINLDSDNFPRLNSSVVIAESCRTCEKLDDDSIALKAIENGAVSYVGSVKIGGVESVFLEKPYLVSTEEIPLSNLVLVNNIEIKKYTDKSIRAVLIGDPLFSMYKSIGAWNSDGSYEYSLPYTFHSKHGIPLKMQNKFEARSVTITQNTVNNADNGMITRVVKIGKTSIVFVTSEADRGNIHFNNNIIIKQVLNKLYNNCLTMVNDFIEGFLSVSTVNIIQILFCSVVVLFIVKIQSGIKRFKKQSIIATLGAAAILFLVEYVLLNVSPSYFLLIYNILLFFILNILPNLKYRFILAIVNTIIPVYLVVLIAGGNKYLYIQLIPGMFAFILIQLCIYLIINKAIIRMNFYFRKSSNIE